MTIRHNHRVTAQVRFGTKAAELKALLSRVPNKAVIDVVIIKGDRPFDSDVKEIVATWDDELGEEEAGDAHQS